MDISLKPLRKTINKLKGIIAHRIAKSEQIQMELDIKERQQASITEPREDREFSTYKRRTENLKKVDSLLDEAKHLLTAHNEF